MTQMSKFSLILGLKLIKILWYYCHVGTHPSWVHDPFWVLTQSLTNIAYINHHLKGINWTEFGVLSHYELAFFANIHYISFLYKYNSTVYQPQYNTSTSSMRQN